MNDSETKHLQAALDLKDEVRDYAIDQRVALERVVRALETFADDPRWEGTSARADLDEGRRVLRQKFGKNLGSI